MNNQTETKPDCTTSLLVRKDFNGDEDEQKTRQLWLDERRKGIGGSDVAGILGLSKWASPLSVYMSKVGITQDTSATEYMYWGNVLEEPIAQEFQRRTGKIVRRKRAIIKHRKHPILLASIDRSIVGENAGLECKNSGAFNQKEWDKAVPDQYLLQCQHYNNVLGYDMWYLAALVGGNTFLPFEIPRSQPLIDFMEKKCLEFWENHVIPQIPPAPTHLEIDRNILKDQYKDVMEHSEIVLDKEAEKLAETAVEAKKKMKELKQIVDESENLLREKIGRHAIAICPGFEINSTPYEKTILDAKAVKEHEPVIFDKYEKTSTIRPLRIKRFKVKFQ